MYADYIIKSKNVFTSLELLPQAASVILSGKKIKAVVPYGEEETYIGEKTCLIDAGEKLVMPGFVDAHTHFFQGAIAASDFVCCELQDARSEDECVEMMRQFEKKHKDQKRLRGTGWFITKWDEPKMPSKKSLDQVFPDKAVYLVCADTHSMWLNTKALEECNITSDMPVRSGYVGTFENGELNGLLVEPDAYAPAIEKYMEFSEEEAKTIYLSFLKKAAELGVTCMSEMYAEDYTDKIYQKYMQVKALEKREELTVRLNIFTRLFGYDTYDTMLKWKKEMDSEYFKIAGLKGFIDGVVETYTGLLLEPYTDRPDTCGVGVPLEPMESIKKSVLAANKAKIPVRLHCIADGSVRMALDIFSASNKLYRENHVTNVIEHIENIQEEDIERFQKENVIPSMQPMHLLLDHNFKKIRIGEERAKLEWPIKTMLNKVKIVALGSDYPVVELNPMYGVYAAVTRKNFKQEQAGINPWEKITLGEALRGYTIDAAKVYSLDKKIGSLEKDKYADIIILDANPFSTAEEELYTIKVDTTFFDGRVIYRNS